MAGMGAMAGLAPLDPPVFLLQEISKFQRRFVITFRLLGDFPRPPTGASPLDPTGGLSSPRPSVQSKNFLRIWPANISFLSSFDTVFHWSHSQFIFCLGCFGISFVCRVCIMHALTKGGVCIYSKYSLNTF